MERESWFAVFFVFFVILSSEVGSLQLKSHGSVTFRGQSIQVFADLENRGHYYGTPLAILDVNSTSCVPNILTGTNDLSFRLVLWTAGAQSKLYRHIKKVIDASVDYALVRLVPMDKFRLKWHFDSRTPVQSYRLVDDWKPAQHLPISTYMSIDCDSAQNCSRLREAMLAYPALFQGVMFEYIMKDDSLNKDDITVPGMVLLATPTGSRLKELSPWPADTHYRYASQAEARKLMQETTDMLITQLRTGAFQCCLDENRVRIESQLVKALEAWELPSEDPFPEWKHVLWTPHFSRPDVLSTYLDHVLSADNNYFIIDHIQRSPQSEGLPILQNNTFFGIPIIKDVLYMKISKAMLNEGLRSRYPHVALFGTYDFMAVPTKVYRFNVTRMLQGGVFTTLTVSNKDKVVTTFPVRLAAQEAVGAESQSQQTQSGDETAGVDYNTLRARVADLVANFSANITARLNKVESEIGAGSTSNGVAAGNSTSGAGVVYTRWGRTTCPAGSETVYTGQVVTSSRHLSGGMGMYMCLTDRPVYHTDGRQAGAGGTLHPTEFVDNHGFVLTSISASAFRSRGGAPTRLNGYDMLCAVCRRPGRTSHLTVWGSLQCQNGWHREFYGTINAAKASSKLSTDAICVDEAPEVSPDAARRYDKSEGYNYKITCTSSGTRCPPYKSGKALTCAVCTK